MVLAQPVPDLAGISVHDEDGVARADLDGDLLAEIAIELLSEMCPVEVGPVAEQDELHRRRFRRVAVDGDAGAVGTTLGHLDQHGRDQPAQPRLERRILEKQARRCRT